VPALSLDLCLVRQRLSPSQQISFMKILRVLGLFLAIVFARFLVPDLFHAMEDTFLLFFDTLQFVLLAGRDALSSASLVLPH
jgi:hypothetical protein